MKLDMIHHIAIIGRDCDAMLHFYVDQLGFAIVSEYDRPERGDILIKPTAQNGQSFPCPSMRDCVILPLKWKMSRRI